MTRRQVIVKEETDGGYKLPDIIQAAYAGDVETVARLLEEGVSVNTVDERDNLSLLHIGCMQGDEALVDTILEWDRAHGDVDFTIQSRYRPRLAWQYAMNSHHYDIGRKVDRAGLVRSGRTLDLEP